MKIILTYTWGIVNSKGGTEKVLCNMANAMTERGHEVYILCYEDKDGLPFFILNENVKFKNMFRKNLAIGVKIKNIFTINSKKRKLNRKINALKFMGEQFTEEIKYINPDVIVAFTREACYALEETLHKNIPIVFMYHFDADTILNDSFYYDAIANADCIQVLMPSDIEKTKSYILPKHRIVNIPNVVPQYVNAIDYASNVVINVARLTKHQKQQHCLVEAFGRLSPNYPNWELELWGEKVELEYVEELKDIISKYKIEKKVFLKGTTDNVQGKLEKASIFAFPSSFEGFPLSLTEAMSVGLPSIGFKDCPAVNELIVDEENGLLVDHTVEAFANGLERLMSDIELRRKFGAKAKMDMKRYSAEKIWDEWECLFKEVARNNV